MSQAQEAADSVVELMADIGAANPSKRTVVTALNVYYSAGTASKKGCWIASGKTRSGFTHVHLREAKDADMANELALDHFEVIA